MSQSKFLKPLLLLFSLLSLLSLSGFAQSVGKSGKVKLREPRFVEPIAAILNLLKTRPLVALDEGGHHTAQTHAFFRALVQDPRFAATVNDIVVEFGSCKYQDAMDRYVNGEDVPLETLQNAWRDTTQVHVFDNPVYRQFFETVRNVNLRLPKNKKIRVLLGDPAIDWSIIKDFGGWVKQANRDTNAAQIIEREILKKRRKAILIYGGAHVLKRDVHRNFEPGQGNFAGVVEQIERVHPNSTYVVWANTNNDDVGLSDSRKALLPVPSLALLKGTNVGAEDFTSVLSKESRDGDRIKMIDGKRVNVPKAEFAKFRLEDNIDALLYLGPVKYLYKTPYFIETYADEEYFRETVRRSKILNEISLEDIEALRKRFLKKD